MISHTLYCIADGGSKSYSISVPAFSGEDEDFLIAGKMNRFYASTLSAMYGYAKSLLSDNVRRGSYRCTASVDSDNIGKITVRLELSVKLLQKGAERSISSKKSITHLWEKGVIKKKIIE